MPMLFVFMISGSGARIFKADEADEAAEAVEPDGADGTADADAAADVDERGLCQICRISEQYQRAKAAASSRQVRAKQQASRIWHAIVHSYTFRLGTGSGPIHGQEEMSRSRKGCDWKRLCN